MTNKTTLHAAADALVIRDAAGTYYVLTDRVLHEARATTEQRTALVFGCGDQRTIGLIANDVRDREPFQVIGVAALPLPARKTSSGRGSSRNATAGERNRFDERW